mgnify:CR=1 FL=1
MLSEFLFDATAVQALMRGHFGYNDLIFKWRVDLVVRCQSIVLNVV